MKSYIRLSRREKTEVRNEIQQVIESMRYSIARRIFKIFAYELNRMYGFGKSRIENLMLGVQDLSELSGTDEEFWYHLDTVLQKEIGLNFEREEK